MFGRILSHTALAGAIICGLFILASGPGTRFEIWPWNVGLLVLQLGLFAGLIALGASLVFGLIAVLRRDMEGGGRSLLAAVIAGAALAYPLYQIQIAASLPMIHDISTDTDTPPTFEAVLPARKDAANPPEYPGEEVAALQAKAYPDIVPKRSVDTPDQLFDKAEAIVRGLGWEVMAADKARGRIEATATTSFFGFKDDIVIRIVPDGTGSRLDMRSKSRVGKSDIGANAARIRLFMQRLG